MIAFLLSVGEKKKRDCSVGISREGLTRMIDSLRHDQNESRLVECHDVSMSEMLSICICQ